MALVSQIKLPDNSTKDLRASAIPYGIVDDSSTSTAFTVSVPGIMALEDGVACMLKNGVVTSAAGFTINVNELGAKPVYSNMAAATADTTIFNANYTMLFVYDSTRVEGGCWICYRGYNSDNNTIGYQIRGNNATLPMAGKVYRYRILFTSADGSHFVPSNTSSSTNATAKRDVCQIPIDPFGRIVYYSSTTAINVDENPGAASLWSQHNPNIGYSFNRTGAAATMSYPAPVYIKCAPQSDGSAIIDATTPYVQTLPSTEDDKIYIFLGIAYSATNVEIFDHHTIYYYKSGAIREWTNSISSASSGTVTSVGISNATNGGLSVSGSPVTSSGTISIGHSNVLSSAQTTQAVYPIKIDKNGHISEYGSAVTIPTKVSDLTNDSGFVTTDEKLKIDAALTDYDVYYPIIARHRSTVDVIEAAQTRYYDSGGFEYGTSTGTANDVGVATLILGNNIASGTAGNKLGQIEIFGQGSNSHRIVSGASSSGGQRLITIPDKNGIIALTDDIPTVPSNIVNTITTTAGAHTTITSQKGDVSFKIPTTAAHVGAATSDHVHGNITNGGDITATAPTIASGDQIIINDNSASKITNGPTFDGSTTTTALTPKGTWETFLKSYTETDPVFTASAAYGISASDIATWNGSSTYVCEAEVTTFAEAKAAYDDGKKLVCYEGGVSNVYYALVQYDEDLIFYFANTMGETNYVYSLDSDDQWTLSDFPFPSTSNLIIVDTYNPTGYDFTASQSRSLTRVLTTHSGYTPYVLKCVCTNKVSLIVYNHYISSGTLTYEVVNRTTSAVSSANFSIAIMWIKNTILGS